MTAQRGFTLIELLIVVAIIAILAAIAVPNFLEAQTRAKVSRAKADMRSVATAVESYRIDWNIYPISAQWVTGPQGDSHFNSRLKGCTTPIAYITSLPSDPFWNRETMFPITPGEIPTYEYNDWTSAVAGQGLSFSGSNFSLFANLDAYHAFEGGGSSAVLWSNRSAGPDRVNDFQLGTPYSLTGAAGIADGMNHTYDPTNGTVSAGDVVRTNIEQRN
jgi:type II secretion system protein G